MNRSIKIPILESEAELQNKHLKEKDVRMKERLQFLYLLKTGVVRSLSQGTKILGRHRNTLSNWLEKYESGGINGLLERHTSPGCPGKFTAEILGQLGARLADPYKGFKSFSEVQQWLEQEFGLKATYKHVHSICRYKLKSSPKVPRPHNPRQNAQEVETFKKTSTKSSINKPSKTKGIKV